MSILRVTHRSEYRYRQPVILGAHRLMCRPRDSHDGWVEFDPSNALVGDFLALQVTVEVTAE